MLAIFGSTSPGYPPLLAAADPAGGISAPYYASDTVLVGGVGVFASGGKPGYTYSWQSDSGDVGFDDPTNSSSNVYIGAVYPTPYGGNIWCQVTDARGVSVYSNAISFNLYPDV